MSNRRRLARASRSYTDRLRHGPVPKRPRPGRPRLVIAAWFPAVVAVTAEAGHLAAAYLEWPDSAIRGGFHVVIGALLGLVAAVVPVGPGAARLAGATVVAVVAPVLWLVGTMTGASPYHLLPVPGAVGITLLELTVVGVLVVMWRRWRLA